MEANSIEKCPVCGANLVIRSSKYGAFWGCSDYPECQYIRTLKMSVEGLVVKVLVGQTCPQCGGILVLRQGRYGMFIGCSEYPQCDHCEVIDKSDTTMIRCPQCQKGDLVQRKSRYGKHFYACERYPECQFSLKLTPVLGECAYCHYPLLVKKRTPQGNKLFCANKLCAKAAVK